MSRALKNENSALKNSYMWECKRVVAKSWMDWVEKWVQKWNAEMQTKVEGAREEKEFE